MVLSLKRWSRAGALGFLLMGIDDDLTRLTGIRATWMLSVQVS
jgi:hypothetical protein